VIEQITLLPIPAGHNPSSNNVKGSNERLSNIGACNNTSSPLNISPTDEANAALIYAAISAKCSDDGQGKANMGLVFEVRLRDCIREVVL
jgi:hypothetical protein